MKDLTKNLCLSDFEGSPILKSYKTEPLEKASKGSHHEHHKYLRIVDGKYIYDYDKMTVKAHRDAAKEHQSEMSSYYNMNMYIKSDEHKEEMKKHQKLAKEKAESEKSEKNKIPTEVNDIIKKIFGKIKIPYVIEIREEDNWYCGRKTGFKTYHVSIKDVDSKTIKKLIGSEKLENLSYMSNKEIDNWNSKDRHIQMERNSSSSIKNLFDKYDKFNLRFYVENDSKYGNDIRVSAESSPGNSQEILKFVF